MNDYGDDKPVVSSKLWIGVRNALPFALGCWFIIFLVIGVIVKIITIIF